MKRKQFLFFKLHYTCVGYQYVIKNKKQIEKINVPHWHYYNEYTIVDNGSRCESKRIINSTGWIYDCIEGRE